MFKFTEDQEDNRGSGRQVGQAGVILAIALFLLVAGCTTTFNTVYECYDTDGDGTVDDCVGTIVSGDE